MHSFQFKALGTAWSITIDQADFVPETFWQSIVQRTADFENHFSRFREGSEARQFSHTMAGTYPISTEMYQLLHAADRLRQLTKGAYDPAIGALIEATGYNKDYKLKPDMEYVKEWQLPSWQLDPSQQLITIDRPVTFDFGGTGKGYWIDQVSMYLLKSGYAHHLVEGGGDMMATTKADGQGWRVAIEYPGQTDTALGTYQLMNQGFAASDIFRRSWGKWHHFIDHQQKQATQHIAGCAAVAASAWEADQITSVLALTTPELFDEFVSEIGGEYVVILKNGTAQISSNWRGELF